MTDAVRDGVTEVRMPKLNSNDTTYVLLAWLAPPGSAVNAGDRLAEAETSKAVEELSASVDGLLEALAVPGEQCVPGQLIARLHPDEYSFGLSQVAAAAGAPAATEPAPADDHLVTVPAAALIAELGVPEDVVRSWGLAVVKRADVERLAGPGADPDVAGGPPSPDPDVVVTEMSRVQRGVAGAVTLSHREVPAAFTVAEVDVTDALAAARQLTRAHRTIIGLAELTVAAIAARRAADPACFASLAPDGRSTSLRPGAHVGVTFDVGTGLFVPVVRDADRAGLGDLARTMIEHRLTALRGTFRERDLQGANITLTLHAEPGIAFAMPIVFPGQACALSLAYPRAVAVPDGGSGFRARQLVHIGVAFDHRLINGSHAIALLRGVKDLLESADFLASVG